jgi:ATP-dependent protease HslVU (ClpYQ) ATPase subunit
VWLTLLLLLLLLGLVSRRCGKTEIARRLAKLAEAPFIKVGGRQVKQTMHLL